MLTFYRNVTLGLVSLIIVSAAILYWGVVESRLEVSLFPNKDENYAWTRSPEPINSQTKTNIKMRNETGVVEYDFTLDANEPFPYAHYAMYFIDYQQGYRIVDLSKFEQISFKVICDPKNVLMLVLFSFDDKATNLGDLPSRRFSRAAFSCSNSWSNVDIEFKDLNTPHWWLAQYGYDLSDTSYPLNKTMGFAWASSSQTPVAIPLHVRLTDVKLHGHDYRYIYIAGFIVVILWILFVVITFRRYLSALMKQLEEKLKQDQQLIAYKKLSVEPQRDKLKMALLKLLATEYANAELSLESTAATLGSNRSKINDLLKEELGFTFTAYLNKLRLTEAARLLSETEDANISEIAYSVGYNNVSYFNKLFKTEYQCTPKTFKHLYQGKQKESEVKGEADK
jgi:AraC-like DNA-binding protein